jgi:hypothetical protein
VTQLDGLPLALELAAARLAVLSLSTLVRRLGDRLDLLASHAPDAPERQQSLEAAVGWSYDLLSEPEQRLVRCLGVFVGRVSLDAIAAVVGVVGSADREPRNTTAAEHLLPGLLTLAEKSLLLQLPVRPEDWAEFGTLAEPPRQQGAERAIRATAHDVEDEGTEPAFGMLETMREYAWERLARGRRAQADKSTQLRPFTSRLDLHGRAKDRPSGPTQWHRLRRMPRRRWLVVPPSPLRTMRTHRLLRLIAKPARVCARPRKRSLRNPHL